VTRNYLDRQSSLPAIARDFREAGERCGSGQELHQLIASAARELGFDHFALVHHDRAGRVGIDRIRLENYPHSWIERLKSHGRSHLDPVHSACRSTNIGFCWAELSKGRLSPWQRHVLEEAADHGLKLGFTIPIHLPGEPPASCSFAANRDMSLSHERMMSAEIIAAHGFKAARRLLGPAVRPTPPHLSNRQIQCVELIAIGKSDWEIGQILGISEETVRTYVKSARAAYDVTSRVQLALRAYRDGRIGL
jgi:DNA-binding CsgD family transcriptional regulator